MSNDTIRHALAEAIKAATTMFIKDWRLRKNLPQHVLNCYRMGTCFYAIVRQKHHDARWAMRWFLNYRRKQK